MPPLLQRKKLKQRLDRLLDDLEVHIKKPGKKSVRADTKDSKYLARYDRIKKEVNKPDAYTDEVKKDFCDLLKSELETFEDKKKKWGYKESLVTASCKKLEDKLIFGAQAQHHLPRSRFKSFRTPTTNSHAAMHGYFLLCDAARFCLLGTWSCLSLRHYLLRCRLFPVPYRMLGPLIAQLHAPRTEIQP